MFILQCIGAGFNAFIVVRVQALYAAVSICFLKWIRESGVLAPEAHYRRKCLATESCIPFASELNRTNDNDITR